jgi:purine-binding chemotaxis protein CheW
VSSVLDDVELGAEEESLAIAGTPLELITFRLGGQLFGVDLATTLVVADLAKIAVVPGAPRHVLGVMNYRGGIVPVVDLRPLLGLAAGPPRHDAKVLIFDSPASEKGVGCVVDALEDIVATATDHIQAPPEGLSAVSARFVSGVLNLGHELVGVLDLRSIDGRPI